MAAWLMAICTLAFATLAWGADGPGDRGKDRALEALPPSVERAERVDGARWVALVLGNAAYEAVPTLSNPRNDAEDVTESLTALGFEVIEGIDLGHQGMMRKLRDFSVALRGADLALFYYAGHALQVDGRNYMVPIDATLDSREALEFEAVVMDRVLRELERDPRVSVVVLDACRNNPLARSLSRALGASRSTAGEGLAALNAVAPETLIAFSTQPGATAADGTGRNSPFTEALLDHLTTPGLDVEGVFKRVAADVIRTSDGTQVPWRSSSLTQEVYLVEGGAAPASGAVATGAVVAAREAPREKTYEEQLEELKASQKARLEEERRLEAERQARIEEAREPLLTEASKRWREAEALVRDGGTEGELALRHFIELYDGASVQVDGEIIDVEIPQVAVAKQLLGNVQKAGETLMQARRAKRTKIAGALYGAALLGALAAYGTNELHDRPENREASPRAPLLLAANYVAVGATVGLGLTAVGFSVSARF